MVKRPGAGNRSEKRGRRPPTGSRIDLAAHPDAVKALPWLAALRFGRPVESKAEIAAFVAALVEEERQRVLGPAPAPMSDEALAALMAEDD